ncbi:hypothetical protein G3480_11245 [Thiorhodococcus mannitoliphagus]|uniref:Uncharacterized protein n=1 Tax=Thiorhodococcus mannitoliphagus TaxID=329406 RepID=A0A6P1DTV2_9GAMM|nr:hypothetical protein [Thiorhodococcus mannitoliphagus]NEX20880.1 hypothetical protein [Thiorhodococcus mannitoliphagus]
MTRRRLHERYIATMLGPDSTPGRLSTSDLTGTHSTRRWRQRDPMLA